MKERKGPFGLMVGGIVDTVVQSARRRAQDREPRALVYDASGRPRLVPADAPGRAELISTAARLIELTGQAPVDEETETETETDIDPADVRSVSAVEPDPDEVVTDAEIVSDDVTTAEEEVATADEVVADADVVAPDPADDERP